ncbi:hypothetical protein MNBD_BACTEROID03-2146 [hydrothermal vent metagenome]|uniref:Uncharacterized protein n=1 Tax=hydrothermal vent metagenome TaxID=652676 RepID=A0A3B0TKH8_9ZZZZ
MIYVKGLSDKRKAFFVYSPEYCYSKLVVMR